MRSLSHWATFTLALGVVVPGTATEAPDQTTAVVAATPDFAAKEITGTIDRPATGQSLLLSDEQRGLIFLDVINLPDIPEADVVLPESPAALPETVELQELPALLVRSVPLLRGHKFVKLDDRILVVRPSDRIVVSQIPRYRLLP
jgi:hypothetical protein